MLLERQYAEAMGASHLGELPLQGFTARAEALPLQVQLGLATAGAAAETAR